MISVNISPEQKVNIQFDMPIPSSIYNEKAYTAGFFFLKKEKGFTEYYNQDKALIGLSCPVDRFYPFIQKLQKRVGVEESLLATLDKDNLCDKDEGLQVNFHQNPFDTPERYWKFILDQGNFSDYFLNRFFWYAGPKRGMVTRFPLHVDLESANTCNMNCPMCYRDRLENVGQMDFEIFKKAIDECTEHNVFSVRLSWRGETLTHPRIKEMIAYSTKQIKNVSFLTNAFYLDEEMADCFIENGVSYVAVSFDGINENYEKIRHPAKFEENYKRLAMLKEKKKAAQSTLPQVRVCTIWPAIKDNSEEYYNTMKEVSDYVVCNPYINFRGEMTIKENFICQYPWERIVIAYNGDTQCCTGWNAKEIILGNIKTKSIYEMWHSEELNRIRKLHAEGRRMELGACADCRHGAKGDPNVSVDEIIGRGF